MLENFSPQGVFKKNYFCSVTADKTLLQFRHHPNSCSTAACFSVGWNNVALETVNMAINILSSCHCADSSKTVWVTD